MDLVFPSRIVRASNDLEQISNDSGALRKVKGISSTIPRVLNNPAHRCTLYPEKGPEPRPRGVESEIWIHQAISLLGFYCFSPLFMKP